MKSNASKGKKRMKYSVEIVIMGLYFCLLVEGMEVVEKDMATLRGKIFKWRLPERLDAGYD